MNIIKKYINFQFLVSFLFLLIFIFLGVFITKLHFYIDDFPYALDKPSLTQNFFAFFKSYTAYHGLYRPIALIYYYGIYSFYWISSSIAHLIPWAIHVAAGYLLYRVLVKQGMLKILAVLAGLIFVLHPFATEQYMWFSANPGTLANLIFLIQIAIIEKVKSKRKVIALVVSLSLISVLLYESTFFFFIPLAYLIYTKYRQSLTLKFIDFFKILSLNTIPVIFYIASKILIKGKGPRPLVDNIQLLSQNVVTMFNNLIKVYASNYYIDNFWLSYFGQGWNLITSSPLMIVVFIIFIISILILPFIAKNGFINKNKSTIVFWFLVSLTSLFPLVANKEFYFGFRSLFLPFIVGFVFFLWIAQRVFKKSNLQITLGVIIIIAISFMLINITITEKYRQQYLSDINLAKKIANAIKSEGLGSNPHSVNILLESDIPFDSRDEFLHADHLLSCFFYEWSSLSCLSMVTESAKVFIIEHSDGRKTIQAENIYSEILQKEPLYLKYNKDKSLIINKDRYHQY